MRLILVPTAAERDVLLPWIPVDEPHSRLELCGFGPIAAAARTSMLVSQLQPSRVYLLGIAGTFTSRLRIGTAHVFDRVTCYGVGRGTGEAFRSAPQIGWPQWPDESGNGFRNELLPLASHFNGTPADRLLLTACAASASAEDVALRLQLHPDAVAEDMEGYGVALACWMAGVELQIVRGISNRVGELDRRNWQVGMALEAAGRLAKEALTK